jgi:hypothetical protein
MAKKTTTERTYMMGVIHDGYKADDHNGHKGYGLTKEDANDALERAQKHDFKWCEKTPILGLYHDEPQDDE